MNRTKKRGGLTHTENKPVVTSRKRERARREMAI